MKRIQIMPNTAVLNSRWQMFFRKYWPAVNGLLWGISVLALGIAYIASQAISLLGVGLCLIGLACLIFYGAEFSVARESSTRYDLAEWCEAVREQYGRDVDIVLKPSGRVEVHDGVTVLGFENAERAVLSNKT